jgi:hypothetical protein
LKCATATIIAEHAFGIRHGAYGAILRHAEASSRRDLLDE